MVIVGDVKYLRITNLDDTNYVELILNATEVSDGMGGVSYPGTIMKLEAGKTFMLGLPSGGYGADKSGSEVAAADLASLISVKAKANTAAVDLQVFVACA